MIRTLSVGGFLLVLLAGPGAAQNLLDTLRKEVLVYYRMPGPWQSLQALLSGDNLFVDPKKTTKEANDGFTEFLDESNDMLGFESGSVSTWVKSITSMEAALYDLQLTDDEPELDFSVALHTPLAKTIYDTVTNYLEEEALAERNEKDGETEVNVLETMDLLIAQREDIILLASSKKRLRGTLAALRAPAGTLATSPRFAAAVGSKEGDTLCYAHLAPFMRMMTEDVGPLGMMELKIIEQLGLMKLKDLGYRETKKGGTTLGLTSSDVLPAFDLLSAKAGKPDLLRRLPMETAFALHWHGDPQVLWKKASTFLLDPEKFALAPMVEEQLRVTQRMLETKLEDVAAVLAPGVLAGIMPHEEGQGTNEDWFFVGHLSDAEKGRELLQKVIGLLAKRAGNEVETHQLPGATVLLADPRLPAVALGDDDRFVFGTPSAIRRIQAGFATDGPALGSVPAMQKLKPEASAYVWVGIGTLARGLRNDDAPVLNPSAGLAIAADLSPKKLALHSRQPLAQAITSAPFFLLTARSAETEAHTEALEAERAARVAEQRARLKDKKKDDKKKPGGGK